MKFMYCLTSGIVIYVIYDFRGNIQFHVLAVQNAPSNQITQHADSYTCDMPHSVLNDSISNYYCVYYY